MGNSQSGTEPKVGFHVLKIEQGSPAAKANLAPYFDYIIAVNGVSVLQENPNVVAEMSANHVDQPMKMTVYNARTDDARELTIMPSRSWGGKTLLGASIRFCRYDNAPSRVWRILDVEEGSPAQLAGLIPMQDWIIGSPDVAVYSEDDFYNLMIHNIKKPIKIIVFNLNREECREAVITPDFEWGGQGCLGCDVGGGVLHQIPPQNKDPPQPASEPAESHSAAVADPPQFLAHEAPAPIVQLDSGNSNFFDTIAELK